MPTTIPVMPIIALVLILLPVRLSSLQMKGLAFFLWFVGGLVLSWRGAVFLFEGANPPSHVLLGLVVFAALVIGIAKGKFLLSKTSQKNIDRIDAFTAPQRPIQVYSLRSWIIIGIMVLISVSMTKLTEAGLIQEWLRGAVNLGIGAALLMSSMAYIKALSSNKPPAIPS
jgi:hypothetical protein